MVKSVLDVFEGEKSIKRNQVIRTTIFVFLAVEKNDLFGFERFKRQYYSGAFTGFEGW